ncbi:cysteine dioxygenase [Falsiroseomonas sp. CW058]|uniref:cysteine dioxygenase family protein n=1 Tax=Falsiroseomonas sp. CW058 TaxID=3388664 RepID=UPI003D324458
MTFIRPRSALDTMLATVAAAARGDAAARPRAVADAIAAFAADPLLLDGREVPGSAERYVRHLLHADPAGGYAVVALVWQPGQMSPVHGHKAWCAFAVHQGVLTETCYEPGDPPVPATTRLLAPGAGGHGPADPRLIHRLANLSCRPAISIHCYGVSFDRFGSEVNEIHAA